MSLLLQALLIREALKDADQDARWRPEKPRCRARRNRDRLRCERRQGHPPDFHAEVEITGLLLDVWGDDGEEKHIDYLRAHPWGPMPERKRKKKETQHG